MATLDYPKIRRAVDKALVITGHDKAKEADAFLRKTGAVAGGGDAWNPTPGSATDYPVTVTLVDYRDADIDGTLILVGDRRALISAEGLAAEPTPNDTLVFKAAGVDSEVYDIIRANPVNPAGTALLYDVQVRK